MTGIESTHSPGRGDVSISQPGTSSASKSAEDPIPRPFSQFDTTDINAVFPRLRVASFDAMPDASSSSSSSRTDRPTSPETAYSSNSAAEINDLLSPLPADTPPGTKTRPPVLRGLTMPARTSYPLPSPSPPLAGLSELLAGPSHSEAYSQSYFPPVSNDPGSPRMTQRRPPAYSPFRSHYGERMAHQRPTLVPPEAKIPHAPPDSPSSSGTPPTASQEDTIGQPRAASDSGVLSISSARLKKGPKIRNAGHVLAPHGSFTSARPRSSTVSSGVSESSVRSAFSTASSPLDRSSPVQEPDPAQRDRLLKEASRGDQLALYRLGWRPQRTKERHSLGTVEDIWGPSLPQSSDNRRSSGTSTASQSSNRHSPSTEDTKILRYPPPSTPPISSKPPQSDLFADAAHLALRSTASSNITRDAG